MYCTGRTLKPLNRTTTTTKKSPSISISSNVIQKQNSFSSQNKSISLIFQKQNSFSTVSSKKDIQKKKLVILGTGWAGFRLARDVDKRYYDVTVISPRNHFVFTPLLASSSVGTLEFRSVVEPIRTVKDITFHQAYANVIHPENKTVGCRSVFEDSPKIQEWSPEFDEKMDQLIQQEQQQTNLAVDNNQNQNQNENNKNSTQVAPSTIQSFKEELEQFQVPYDELVISVGAVNQTFGIKGVREHTHFLKEINEARAIREHIIECFERASEPDISPQQRKDQIRFVVVGGGPTGVEFCGEMADFLRQDVSKAYPNLANDIEVILLEAGQSILSAFERQLGEYAEKHLAKQNIQLRTGVKVKEVQKGKIILDSNNNTNNNTNNKEKEETINFGLCVWSTGIAPRNIIRRLPYLHDKLGRLLTDEYCQVRNAKDIYAIGDCAAIEEQPLPSTAQVAVQKAKFLAKHFNTKAINEQYEEQGQEHRSIPLKPFNYRHRGMLAYLGSYKGLAEVKGVEGTGFGAWLLWRSAYATDLVSWRNKIMVPLTWFKTFWFGRDTSKF